MIKTKAIGLTLFIALFAVLAFGTVNIGCRPVEKKPVPVKKEVVKKPEVKEYVIKKGDTFWGIAKKELGNACRWEEIQKLNPLMKPRKLKIGSTIKLPEKGAPRLIKKVERVKKEPKKRIAALPIFDPSDPNLLKALGQESIFNYRNPGGNPYKGTPEQALILLLYPEDKAKLLEEKIKKEEFEWDYILDGDEFLMVFGKNKMRFSRADLKKPLAAKKYTVTANGWVYTVKFVLACGNLTRYPEEPIPPPKEELPPEKWIPKIPEKEVIIPPVEKKIERPKPPIILKIPQIYRPPKIFKYKPIKCIDFELNARQGFWWGEDSHGEFSYTEGGRWNSCWYQGEMIGFYATRDSGKVDDSEYRWKSGIGGIINPSVQVGVRYLDFYKKDDGSVLPHGGTAKFRLMYAKITGKNPESLYHMTQEDLLIGIYMEYIRFLSQNTVAAVTFEAWFSLWSSQESTWSGDSPSNRGWIQIGAYIQKYINDHWAIRLGGYGFHHLWDKEFGIGGYPEIRYNDWLLAGFNASLGFDNGFSYGPYVGVETGGLLKRERDKAIVSGIIRIDDDGNPIEEGGEKNEENAVITEEINSSDDIKEIELKESPINTPMF